MDEREMRKQRVYEMLQANFRREQMAAKLFVSLATVKRIIAEIYSEAGVSNRREFREKCK